MKRIDWVARIVNVNQLWIFTFIALSVYIANSSHSFVVFELSIYSNNMLSITFIILLIHNSIVININPIIKLF